MLATREDLARRYSVCLRTVDEWTATGMIPVVRLGRRLVRFPLRACDEIIIGRHTVQPEARR